MTRREEAVRADLAARRAARGDVTSVQLWDRGTLAEGDEFVVEGERGRFCFTSARVVDGGCQWVEAFQCDRRYPQHARSFSPERVVGWVKKAEVAS